MEFFPPENVLSRNSAKSCKESLSETSPLGQSKAWNVDSMEAHPFNPFTQWPFLLLMGTAILFISHCVSHFSRRASLFRRFAGPKGLPILGVSWALRKPESLLNILLEWDKKYGPTFYMLGGPNIDIISFSAPEDLEVHPHAMH